MHEVIVVAGTKPDRLVVVPQRGCLQKVPATASAIGVGCNLYRCIGDVMNRERHDARHVAEESVQVFPPFEYTHLLPVPHALVSEQGAEFFRRVSVIAQIAVPCLELPYLFRRLEPAESRFKLHAVSPEPAAGFDENPEDNLSRAPTPWSRSLPCGAPVRRISNLLPGARAAR